AGGEPLRQAGGPAHLRGRPVDRLSLPDEGVEPRLQRPVPGDGLHEVAHALEVTVRGRGEQVLEVVEVDVHRPERDSGTLGDLPGGRPEVPVVEQGQQRLDDGVAGARGTCRPSVGETGRRHGRARYCSFTRCAIRAKRHRGKAPWRRGPGRPASTRWSRSSTLRWRSRPAAARCACTTGAGPSSTPGAAWPTGRGRRGRPTVSRCRTRARRASPRPRLPSG